MNKQTGVRFELTHFDIVIAIIWYYKANISMIIDSLSEVKIDFWMTTLQENEVNLYVLCVILHWGSFLAWKSRVLKTKDWLQNTFSEPPRPKVLHALRFALWIELAPLPPELLQQGNKELCLHDNDRSFPSTPQILWAQTTNTCLVRLMNLNA